VGVTSRRAKFAFVERHVEALLRLPEVLEALRVEPAPAGRRCQVKWCRGRLPRVLTPALGRIVTAQMQILPACVPSYKWSLELAEEEVSALYKRTCPLFMGLLTVMCGAN
jgi:hypothetical protein